jgi:ABC-type glycerol-3-phosphate transport system permease component
MLNIPVTAAARIDRAVSYASMAVLATIVLLPLSWVFFGAFKHGSEIFQYPITLWPRRPTLDNFTTMLAGTPLLRNILNTAIVTLGTLILTLSLGTLAAYGFSRWNFRGKDAVLIGILVLQLIPSSVNLIPYYLLLRSVSLLNSHAGLIIVYTAVNLPFTIWIMKGFLDGLPRSLDEAGVLDGCSRLRVFWSILLPLSKPGLSAAGFLVCLACWGELLIPLSVANSNDVHVVSVGIYYFFGADNSDYNFGFASSLIAICPLLALYLFAQRYLIAGMTAGAEK